MKIFIIHGTYGNPHENWFQWLKENLESEGHTVFVPEFPTPKNQNLERWMEIFNDFYLSKVDEDTLFVGHSLAPVFILSILEKISPPKPLKASFFISGFLEKLGNSEFDNLNKTFTTKNFNWDKIKQNCNEFYIFHSNNDPYVPLRKAEELSDKLGTSIIIIKNAGHFNESSGYTKFEELLKKIKEVIKNEKRE